MRGTSEFLYENDGDPGLIPAGAGNITPLGILCSYLWGSSPQVRGTSLPVRPLHASRRLIPAGAGNMRPRTSPRRYAGAHPRRCGEHLRTDSVTDFSPGSSPQVRGTSEFFDQHNRYAGLIPAGAGNIVIQDAKSAALRAHPRRCGEHPRSRRRHSHDRGLIPAGAGNIVIQDAKSAALRGSSPQVRGTSPALQRSPLPAGLIPAGAGNIGE